MVDENPNYFLIENFHDSLVMKIVAYLSEDAAYAFGTTSRYFWAIFKKSIDFEGDFFYAADPGDAVWLTAQVFNVKPEYKASIEQYKTLVIDLQRYTAPDEERVILKNMGILTHFKLLQKIILEMNRPEYLFLAIVDNITPEVFSFEIVVNPLYAYDLCISHILTQASFLNKIEKIYGKNINNKFSYTSSFLVNLFNENLRLMKSFNDKFPEKYLSVEDRNAFYSLIRVVDILNGAIVGYACNTKNETMIRGLINGLSCYHQNEKLNDGVFKLNYPALIVHVLIATRYSETVVKQIHFPLILKIFLRDKNKGFALENDENYYSLADEIKNRDPNYAYALSIFNRPLKNAVADYLEKKVEDQYWRGKCNSTQDYTLIVQSDQDKGREIALTLPLTLYALIGHEPWDPKKEPSPMGYIKYFVYVLALATSAGLTVGALFDGAGLALNPVTNALLNFFLMMGTAGSDFAIYCYSGKPIIKHVLPPVMNRGYRMMHHGYRSLGLFRENASQLTFNTANHLRQRWLEWRPQQLPTVEEGEGAQQHLKKM